MVVIGHSLEPAGGMKKRKLIYGKKGSKARKKPRMPETVGKKVKIDRKMKRLFRKRAREYNSDDEGDDESAGGDENVIPTGRSEEPQGPDSFADEGEDEGEVHINDGVSDDDEDGEIQPGIIKFVEGCRAFKMAFRSIISKNISDESLGPVLSAHKKLVAEKLAEEEAERKVKGEAKKEKQLLAEKGHVKPANFLDSHEKLLIGVATKGVVKLFNAVNKAQNAQKGLNPSRSKDAKATDKRRKQAFFSELGKTSLTAKATPNKLQTSSGAMDDEGPAWAPLRDNYMLANSRLKDWDKMPVQDAAVAEDMGRMSEDSSSSDDD